MNQPALIVTARIFETGHDTGRDVSYGYRATSPAQAMAETFAHACKASPVGLAVIVTWTWNDETAQAWIAGAKARKNAAGK